MKLCTFIVLAVQVIIGFYKDRYLSESGMTKGKPAGLNLAFSFVLSLSAKPKFLFISAPSACCSSYLCW